MTDPDSQAQSSDSALSRFWNRIPVVIRAIVLGIIVFEIGSVASIARNQSLSFTRPDYLVVRRIRVGNAFNSQDSPLG